MTSTEQLSAASADDQATRAQSTASAAPEAGGPALPGNIDIIARFEHGFRAGDQATIDLRPGGDAAMTFRSGLTVDMRVERVEEPTVFGFTWRLPDLPEDDPRRTYVEFTLEAAGAGTRLRLVETGFAQLPDESRRDAYDSHAKGWASELGELAEYLDAA